MRKKRAKKRKYHCEKYDIFAQYEFQNHLLETSFLACFSLPKYYFAVVFPYDELLLFQYITKLFSCYLT